MKNWMVKLQAGWNRIVIEMACKIVRLVGMRIPFSIQSSCLCVESERFDDNLIIHLNWIGFGSSLTSTSSASMNGWPTARLCVMRTEDAYNGAI